MPDRSCTYINPYGAAACTECGRDIPTCTCVNPDHSAQERLHSVDGLVFRMIRDELIAAREKFPDNRHQFDAMIEEVGEAAQALMEHDRQLGTSPQEILRELVQVATMAIRVATEGDADYLYEFPAVEEDLPSGPIGRRYD